MLWSERRRLVELKRIKQSQSSSPYLSNHDPRQVNHGLGLALCSRCIGGPTTRFGLSQETDHGSIANGIRKGHEDMRVL